MTREEVEALPIGTEVLVRATIRERANSDGRADAGFIPIKAHGWYGWIAPQLIHSIAPATPLVIGDRVTAVGVGAGAILAIDSNLAWIRFDHKHYGHSTLNLDLLTRITDEPK